jgi:hypothetical protein
MSDLPSLAKRLLSRRDRDQFGTAEWNEIADIVGSDLAIDRAALASECERLRGEVARLEGLLRSVGPKRVAARRA